MNLRNEQQSQDNVIPKLKKDYALMIDFFSTTQDWKALCIAIAKDEPEIVAKYITGSDPLTTVSNDTIEKYQTIADSMPNSKIQAIKACRQITGWGLREAKYCIDSMIENVAPMTARNIATYIEQYSKANF